MAGTMTHNTVILVTAMLPGQNTAGASCSAAFHRMALTARRQAFSRTQSAVAILRHVPFAPGFLTENTNKAKSDRKKVDQQKIPTSEPVDINLNEEAIPCVVGDEVFKAEI